MFDNAGLQNFDAKTVHRPDWGAAGAGLLALVCSFLSWYHYSINAFGISHDYGGIGGGLTGFLVRLLTLAGLAGLAMAVAAPQVPLPVSPRLAGVAAFGLAALLTLFKLAVRPRPCFLSICAPGHYSPSIGLYLTLVALVVATAIAAVRLGRTGPGRA
jgi:hypothetical protein